MLLDSSCSKTIPSKRNSFEKIPSERVTGMDGEKINAIKKINFSTFSCDVVEHVWHLPKLLHVHFHSGNNRLVMAVDTNTLFCAFSTISKALTIFLLTIDTIASARWMLNHCWDGRSHGSLFACAGFIKLRKYLSYWLLLRQFGWEQTWLFKHIFFVFKSKYIFTLNSTHIVLHMIALIIESLESLLIAQKSLQIHNKNLYNLSKVDR